MPLVVLLQLAKEVIPYHALLTRHTLKHLLDTYIINMNGLALVWL